MCLRHFWPFLKVARCSMDTINEREKIFTFYYTSSTLLKGWRERGGSRMKGQVLYKPKHNKTISQQSPDSWLFVILFLFVCLYGHLCWCITQLKSTHFYDTHKTEFLTFKDFMWNWLCTFIKPLVKKIIQKAYSWKPGESVVFFLVCGWSFQVACQALTYYESKDYLSKVCQL